MSRLNEGTYLAVWTRSTSPPRWWDRCNNNVKLIDDEHTSWNRRCNCLKCAGLHNPNTMLGVVIIGMVIARRYKYKLSVFVDLSDQRCYKVIDCSPSRYWGLNLYIDQNIKPRINQNAHVLIDSIITRFEHRFEHELM